MCGINSRLRLERYCSNVVSHLDRRLREHILLYDISFSVTPTPKPAVRDEAWGVDSIGVNWKVPPRPSGKRCSGNYKGGKIGRMDSLSRATRPPGDSDPISHVIINQIIHVKLAQE